MDLVSSLTFEQASDAIRNDGLLPFVGSLVDRIEEVDPQIFALLPEDDRRRRLLADATLLADRFPDTGDRPPLFGIPVAIKDIIHAQGFETGAGTQLPVEAMQGREGYLVSRLKELGAFIVGKAVTTEFAMLAPNGTRNPHDVTHTPGGSSSGSTAAVAAGLCVFALGTQTVGSIIRPASFCGIAGFKPSFGRMPSDGLLYVSPSLDHLGFFAADLAGLGHLASLTLPGWQELGDENQQVLTIGIPDGPYLQNADEAMLRAFENHIAALAREPRVEVTRVEMFPDFEEIGGLHNLLARAEFAEQHEDLFPHFGALYRSLTANLLREGRNAPPERVERARHRQGEVRNAIHAAMDAQGIDVWLAPAAKGAAPPGLESTGDPVMNGIWTFAGLPSLTLPFASDSTGLPLGIQLAGRFGEDERVLKAAAELSVLLPPDGTG